MGLWGKVLRGLDKILYPLCMRKRTKTLPHPSERTGGAVVIWVCRTPSDDTALHPTHLKLDVSSYRTSCFRHLTVHHLEAKIGVGAAQVIHKHFGALPSVRWREIVSPTGTCVLGDGRPNQHTEYPRLCGPGIQRDGRRCGGADGEGNSAIRQRFWRIKDL